MDTLSPQEVKNKALTNLNQLFKETATYFNFDYKILVYNLLQKGYVKMEHLEEASGKSDFVLRKMVDDVKKYINLNGE